MIFKAFKKLNIYFFFFFFFFYISSIFCVATKFSNFPPTPFLKYLLNIIILFIFINRNYKAQDWSRMCFIYYAFYIAHRGGKWYCSNNAQRKKRFFFKNPFLLYFFKIWSLLTKQIFLRTSIIGSCLPR